MLSTATREGMKEQVVDNLPKRIKQVKFGIMCVDSRPFSQAEEEEEEDGNNRGWKQDNQEDI